MAARYVCGLSFFYFIHLPTSVFSPFCCSCCSAQVRKKRYEVFKTLATVIKYTTEKKGMEEMERELRVADSGCDKHLQVQSARDDCAGKTGEGEHLSAVKIWQ